jgi:hypothetical protein
VPFVTDFHCSSQKERSLHGVVCACSILSIKVHSVKMGGRPSGEAAPETGLD